MRCKTSVFAVGISAVCVCLQARYRKTETIVFWPHSLGSRDTNLDGLKLRVHKLNFS